MSSPSFFTEGSTPRVKDTLWRIEQKMLGALVGSGGGGGSPLTLQVFEGAGDPVGLQPGQDATKAAIYINTDNGVTVGWNVGTASWML